MYSWIICFGMKIGESCVDKMEKVRAANKYPCLELIKSRSFACLYVIWRSWQERDFQISPIWTWSTDRDINNLAFKSERGSISRKKKLYSKQKINEKIYRNGVRTIARVSQFSSRHGNKSFDVQNDVTVTDNWYLASSSIFINHRFPLSWSYFLQLSPLHPLCNKLQKSRV